MRHKGDLLPTTAPSPDPNLATEHSPNMCEVSSEFAPVDTVGSSARADYGYADAPFEPLPTSYGPVHYSVSDYGQDGGSAYGQDYSHGFNQEYVRRSRETSFGSSVGAESGYKLAGSEQCVEGNGRGHTLV